MASYLLSERRQDHRQGSAPAAQRIWLPGERRSRQLPSNLSTSRDQYLGVPESVHEPISRSCWQCYRRAKPQKKLARRAAGRIRRSRVLCKQPRETDAISPGSGNRTTQASAQLLVFNHRPIVPTNRLSFSAASWIPQTLHLPSRGGRRLLRLQTAWLQLRCTTHLLRHHSLAMLHPKTVMAVPETGHRSATLHHCRQVPPHPGHGPSFPSQNRKTSRPPWI